MASGLLVDIVWVTYYIPAVDPIGYTDMVSNYLLEKGT
jgi:hypothetical protein